MNAPLDPHELAQLLPAVIEIGDRAGREIMRIYRTAFDVTLKQDRSPLTQADLAAQHLIAEGLEALTPRIGMLGEESPPQRLEECRGQPRLWLVDPLDGTREFVKRNDEFCVNIALLEDGHPVLGVVLAPAHEVLYAAARGCGAFRRGADGERVAIQVRRPAPTPLRVLASRSHADAVLDRMLDRLGANERLRVGSALKFGLLAEGRGDLYLRRGPTSAWDTAAGQAVLQEAGGGIMDLAGQPLRYELPDHCTNPSFLAFGDGSRDWSALLAAH